MSASLIFDHKVTSFIVMDIHQGSPRALVHKAGILLSSPLQGVPEHALLPFYHFSHFSQHG